MANKKSVSRAAASIRKEILALDKSILALIADRAELTDELIQSGQKSATSDDLISKACKSAKKVDAQDAQQLLQQIDRYCAAKVTPQDVCYLGPIFSYSYLAAIRHFGAFQEFQPVNSIAGVFARVSDGRSMYGLVPIENSTDGRIVDTLSMFAQHSVAVVHEVHLPINHCLIGAGKLSDIKEVRSKAQALSQCRNWLDSSLSKSVKRVATDSSSVAAQDAKGGGKSIAAIASQEAAQGLGLNIIEKNIEDHAGNVTRFAIIVDPQNPKVELPKKTGTDKSSIMFEIPHRPGALADVINIFKRSKLNLTWIESFPKPDAFSEYTFFAEFQGHRNEARVRNALTTLKKKTEVLTFLGSYPEYSLDQPS